MSTSIESSHLSIYQNESLICSNNNNNNKKALQLYKPIDRYTSNKGLNRSRTLISFNQSSRQTNNGSINIQTQPATITLNLQELTPTFPLLPSALVHHHAAVAQQQHQDKNNFVSKHRLTPNYYYDKKLQEKITPLFRSNTLVGSFELSNIFTKFK